MFRFVVFGFAILISVIHTAICANVGFFCSPGFFSHDQYSNHLAETLASRTRHNISIMQIKTLKFKKSVNFSRPYIFKDFSRDNQTELAQKKILQLVWKLNIPVDIYNLSGNLVFLKTLLKFQEPFTRNCLAALSDRNFISAIKNRSLHLVVMDYSDCAGRLAAAMNLPAAHINSLAFATNTHMIGVPSNPAYVPLSYCNFEPYEKFWYRALNAFGHFGFMGFGMGTENHTYNWEAEKVRSILGTQSSEWRTVMLGNHWELFLDMARPVARNMRYFGCEHCPRGDAAPRKVSKAFFFDRHAKSGDRYVYTSSIT